jgi:peptidyl-prolyl cis-trans isomerase D
VEATFRAAQGETVLAEDQGDKVILQVTAIDLPARNPEDAVARRVDQEIRRTMEDDLLAQYVVRLQTDLGTRINREAVQRVVGGQQN